MKFWDFQGFFRTEFKWMIFLDFDKNEFFVQLYAQIFINTATWCMKYEGRLSVLRRRCRCAKLNRARCLFSSVWALYKKIPSSSFILEKSRSEILLLFILNQDYRFRTCSHGSKLVTNTYQPWIGQNCPEGIKWT